MKHYQRALLSLYSFLTAVLALIVLFVALGWQEPFHYFQVLLAQQETRWTIVAVSALVFLLAVRLLFAGFRSEKVTHAPVQATGLGQVSITISTLENMIKRSVLKINGVHHVKPAIKTVPDGIAVFVKVQLAPEINIPQTTSEIQSAMREYLERYAGLKLVEARILVEDAPQEPKSRVE
ncbi:MAG: alkaline shock response membrane anchor protein AmaP [Clostridia bacterium]|nr:alkaline shock response membrane anchor protein AmaP [Clostridia bacterium]